MKTSRTQSMIIAVLAGALWFTNAHAAEDDWKYSVTPYLWLPSFKGNFKYTLPPSTCGSTQVETYYLKAESSCLVGRATPYGKSFSSHDLCKAQ
jgi:hypothetical protein